MPIRGTFKHKALKGNEKIKDVKHSGTRGAKDNTGTVQTITIDGVDYIAVKSGGSLTKDNSLTQFNNKDVDVEGTFVGPIFIISSITKAGK